MKPWKLAELNYGHVKTRSYQVAVLPLGATEPHNLHLPYAMDVFEADIMADRICEAAHALGAKVLLLPTIPYGTETNLAGFPFAMNLNPSTLNAVITDLIESVVASGIRKIVIFNSHGGNDIKPLLRELFGRTDARLFLCNWYQLVKDIVPDMFESPGDHAGEEETSFALEYLPDLVGRTPDGSLAADEGAMTPSRFDAVNRGWISITRPWKLLTTNTGAGNPHAATAEKGRKLMRVLIDRVAPFLKQLSDAEIDGRFPF